MRNFILGTDWWTDCDDVVAMRILAREHKKGNICLKAVGINACMEYSAASVEGFLNTEGVCDIPIGIDLNGTDFGGVLSPYQKNLSVYAERYKPNADAEDAVRLYRRILSRSDEPVEIIEIGFLQVVAAVLESEADDISEMSGAELVKEKVSKIWVMAGKWDEENGREHNFENNSRSRIASDIFCRKCPVPVTFLGFEVGYDVITGDKLSGDDVLYKAMCDHGSNCGRSSWDPMLVLLAVIGDEQKAGYDTVTGTASVSPETGENNFAEDSAGLHKYVVKNKDNDFYKNMINDMIKSEEK